MNVKKCMTNYRQFNDELVNKLYNLMSILLSKNTTYCQIGSSALQLNGKIISQI